MTKVPNSPKKLNVAQEVNRTMLKAGELTPYFNLPSPDNEPYNLWDSRQRKNLVLVFLPSPE
ncbi:MAG: hypothetical protein O7G31_08695 [Calditrichaeota bacterium]|nr:hypothetical protein [Calditrichota bacterium]